MNNLRRERQLAGITKAKKEGQYKRCPTARNKDRIKEMLAKGMRHSAIAKELGCSTKTV